MTHISFELQPADNLLSESSELPAAVYFERWINAALKDESILSQANVEIVVRIVGEAESQALNHRYRKKDKPTNVLSFPYDLDEEHIGDLVICLPLVVKEAKEQQKTTESHWAHLVVHGCLHLVGYDHISDQDAHRMEQREVEILSEFGYENPYGEDE